MRLRWAFLMLSFLMNGSLWANNFEQALKQAQKENKFILLNFSGSDWCGPCIRMHKEILENEVFQKYANVHLIYVNADFPRLKKHQLTQEQQKENDELAEKYNPTGIFPYTLLLNNNGKVISTWNGFYENGADSFTAEVKNLVEKNK
jgi:thioredoxin-related protein